MFDRYLGIHQSLLFPCTMIGARGTSRDLDLAQTRLSSITPSLHRSIAPSLHRSIASSHLRYSIRFSPSPSAATLRHLPSKVPTGSDHRVNNNDRQSWRIEAGEKAARRQPEDRPIEVPPDPCNMIDCRLESLRAAVPNLDPKLDQWQGIPRNRPSSGVSGHLLVLFPVGTKPSSEFSLPPPSGLVCCIRSWLDLVTLLRLL